MTTITRNISTDLTHTTCFKCGVDMWIPSEFNKNLIQTRSTFYCLNGHSQHYIGQTEAQKLQAKLDIEQTRRISAEKEAVHNERRRRAEKAAKTRIKNRVANGVCPCCNRTFTNLAKHMNGQHPDYASGES